MCVSEETGWERLPTGVGRPALSVHPATAAPAGGTCAHQAPTPEDSCPIKTERK